MTSRDKQSLSAFADEIHAAGQQTFSVELDVRDYNSVGSAVASIEAHFGHIDILINNAGCNIRKPSLDVTWEDWNTVLDTNLCGPGSSVRNRSSLPPLGNGLGINPMTPG